MQKGNYRDVCMGFALALSIAISSVVVPMQTCLSAQERTVRTDDPSDWKHFQPTTYSKLQSLVPSPTIGGPNLQYTDGVSFPDDPVKGNLVFGKGKNNLPTTIYATGNSPLLIGGKVFIAPKAGKSETIQVNSQQITLWGTSVYTPLPDLSLAANVAQLIPFDPDHTFYLDKTGWPGFVYGQPATTLYIAGKQFVFPAAGKREVVSIKDSQGVNHTVTLSGFPDSVVQPNFIKHTALPLQLSLPQNVEASKNNATTGGNSQSASAGSTTSGKTSSASASTAVAGKGAGGASGAASSASASSGGSGASDDGSAVRGKGAGGAGGGTNAASGNNQTNSGGNSEVVSKGKGAQTLEFKEMMTAKKALQDAGMSDLQMNALTADNLQNNLKHYVNEPAHALAFIKSLFSVSKNQGTKITPEMIESVLRPTINQMGSMPGLNKDAWAKYLPVLQDGLKNAFYTTKLEIAADSQDVGKVMSIIGDAGKAGVQMQASWLDQFHRLATNDAKLQSALTALGQLAESNPQLSDNIKKLSQNLIDNNFYRNALSSGDPVSAMVKNINDAIAGKINASPAGMIGRISGLVNDSYKHSQVTDFLRELAKNNPTLAADVHSAINSADNRVKTKEPKDSSRSNVSPADVTGKGSNPSDWRNFMPSSVPELWGKLVPKFDDNDRDYMGFDDYVHQASADVLFPHDPTKNGYIGNIKSIYAHQGTPTKSGFIAPAAGRKNQVDGGYTLYGTTNFTPIDYNGSIDDAVDFKRIAAHVFSGGVETKQDLNRMYFAYNDDMCFRAQDKVWPYIIYLNPGESVKIDNHSAEISCPAAGQPVTINVGGYDNLLTGAAMRNHMIRIMRMPESPIIPGRIKP